jgi:RNA polymerase sigma-70 factor (ECF subfamily)
VSHLPAEHRAGRASAWSPQDDAPFVVAAQAGDAASFDVLYRRHLRTVYAVLLGRTTRREEAEDLVQDAFLTAWRQIGALRDPAAFAGWMLAIARHLRVDHLRRARPHVSLDWGDRMSGRTGTGGGDRDAAAPLPHGVGARLSAPDADAHRRMEAQRALEAIGALPGAYRETLLLRLVEGMTGPEIAQRTGLTPDSVRVNLCRGMKLLRAALDPSAAGPAER